MIKSVYGTLLSSRRGSVAVEYAFLLPALLLFVLGIMDTGRLLWTNTTLNRAVQAAARCGAVNTVACASEAQIKSYAVDQAFGLSIAASAFTTSTPACGVQVTASHTFTFIIPWLDPVSPFGPSNAITLSAVACYPPAQ